MGTLTKRDAPRYTFAPSSIGGNFPGFDGSAGSDDVEDRVIAPIPNKARAMKEPFIRDTYTKAEALVRASDIAVSIGYSFNQHDGASFQRLMDALRASKGRRLLVVSPDADTVAQAIRPGFPDLAIEPLKATFKQWVGALFPGIDAQ